MIGKDANTGVDDPLAAGGWGDRAPCVDDDPDTSNLI